MKKWLSSKECWYLSKFTVFAQHIMKSLHFIKSIFYRVFSKFTSACDLVDFVALFTGIAALLLAHETLVGTERAQIISILSERIIAYETCVQRVEGKAYIAFRDGRPLFDGCYGESHSLWNALANSLDVSGVEVPDYFWNLDNVNGMEAERANCMYKNSFSDCVSKLRPAMRVCRNNIRHDSLDGEAIARGVYKLGSPDSFSEIKWSAWLQALRDERNECIVFVHSFDKALATYVRRPFYQRYFNFFFQLQVS